jgi:hypothetical protein
VELVDRPPERGVIVYHAKQVEALMRHWWRIRRAVLVAVKADHNESHLADFHVVQNRVWENRTTRFHIPSWPQPGILARLPSRGTRVERISFKGMIGNLREGFRDRAWVEALDRRGIEWVADAVAFRGPASDGVALEWRDYREIDLVLAVRPPHPRGHTDKPAAKLINAWLAGVPALLGREPAYRELRTDALDYVEIDSVDEALRAIDELRARPALYRAMVARGRERAAAFSIDSLVAAWVDFLGVRLPALSSRRSWGSVPYWLRPAARKAQRLLQGRPAR